MSDLAESAPVIEEQIRAVPALEAAVQQAEEQPADVIDAIAALPEQKIDSAVLPEMSNAHPEVDPATISVGGLIKNCPHFAEMYKRDPERTAIEAEQTVEKAQEVVVMREQGMSNKEIKAKMLAENLAYAKERARAIAQEEKAESPKTVTPQQATGVKIEKLTKPVEPNMAQLANQRLRSTSAEQAAALVRATVEEAHSLDAAPDKVQVIPKRTEKPAPKTNVPAKRRTPQAQPKPPRRVEVLQAKAVHEPQTRETAPMPPDDKPRTTTREVGKSNTEKLLSKKQKRVPSDRRAFIANAAHKVVTEKPPVATVVKSTSPNESLALNLGLSPIAKTYSSLASSPQERPDAELAEKWNTTEVLASDELSLVKVMPNNGRPETGWANEQDKEPLKVYEDFTEALQPLVASSVGEKGSILESAGATTVNREFADIEEQAAQPVPAIAIVVAEKLATLEIEKKEVVAPILQDIIALLETEEANSEATETMQAELKELIVVLFEHLNIEEYETVDIERFMAVLLRPDFQLSQPEAANLYTPDLEHDGTQEARIHFASTTASFIADAERGSERLLGTLALLNSPGLA